MVLTVTEDTPADMLTGNMELLVQLPCDHHLHTQRVTVLRSTPMMDLLVQIATAHKLTASSYTLQAIGERDLILPHHPNTPVGALDALQVKLLPKQSTCMPRKTKQTNQPFETTFRLQVHLPRNQLYVSRVSPKMNLGEILDEVCREKNLDRSKYELRHPVNLEETLDLSLSLQDYHLQEVTLYAKQIESLGTKYATLSTQDIMTLQRQEEQRRQQTKQNVFGFMFKKSKESSLSMDSLGARSVSPARSDETARSISPLQPPVRPQRKRRPAPKPPANTARTIPNTSGNSGKDKMTVNHSRNSSDSSGYHEASVLSDNPDSSVRLPETLPRRNKPQSDAPRKLAQTSQSSKSLGNLVATVETFSQGISSTSFNSTGLRKKRAAPPPPTLRPLSSAISTQALERIVDSEELLTSDIEPSKSAVIGVPSKTNSDTDCPKINSNIGISAQSMRQLDYELKSEITCESDCDIQQNCTAEANTKARSKTDLVDSELVKTEVIALVEATPRVEQTRVAAKRAVYQDIPSETDILLQKVSDTLSNVLPTLSSPETSLPLETSYTTTSMNINAVPDCSAIKLEPIEIKNEPNEFHTKSCIDFSVENCLSASTPNITAANSQQDTSDYVSTIGEDLSISDWEYQLPAPPSAFRDSHSPIFDDYDTVTLGSVEAFKEPIASQIAELNDAIDSNNKNSNNTKSKNLSSNVEMYCDQKAKEEMDLMSEIEMDIKQTSKSIVKQALTTSQKSKIDSDLRKEMILELENKIETSTLVQTINKDFDRRNMDSLSAPELAPVDNTLSNFTITTYTKQKSLDIFEEFEEPSNYAKNSEERFIKTFATLSRNNGACNYDKNSTRNTYLINNLSHNRKANKSQESNTNNADCKMEPKIRNESGLSYKWQSFNITNDKTNIQRSKSYILMSNNTKYQNKEAQINARKHESQIEPEIIGMKKARSITDLNVDKLRSNEKFSQWRDNILKNQEKPTKEKQLQSLQVLKSILPQLKNAQQAEENVSKDYNNSLLIQKKYEAESNEHLVRMNATHESRESLESECKPSLKEESTKRYIYTGPPAISLGSWSERSSANVQIKADTDYKLGRNNMTNSSKTIVNINGTKDEKDITNYTSNTDKNNIIKHEFNIDSLTNKNPDESIAKKLIAHTTASNFKISNRAINMVSDLKNEDKPVMMDVELKRISVKTPKEMLKDDENEVDTTSMNFKELIKTFGQYGNFKQIHSNINSQYKFSADHRNIQLSEIERITNSNIKENGYAWFIKATNQNDFSFKNQFEMHGIQQNSQMKRFTSVIGVNGMNQNLESQNEISLKCNTNNAIKINPPMPIVKGFKIPAIDSKINNNQMNHNRLSLVDDFNKNVQSSKNLTMPVITGVMLKNANAKPKLKPVQLDPRDMLLESIRNFGGRQKLKNTTKNY